ncbi:MAG: hypothetical protein KBF73_12100 [Flavobacteriales bacterium]|nr:hypothetical protein [Flavobacteriales bacterium]
MKRIFPNESEYVLLLFTVICISSLTAIYFTRGNTMMWANIIVLAAYRKIVKGEPSNRSSTELNLLWPFVFLYIMFFVANVFAGIDFGAGIVRVSTYDSPFYARLVDFMMLHGVENYEMNPIHSDLIGVKLYHYTENWFTAFCKIGIPDVPTIYIQEFLVNPIFFSICVLAFYEAIREQAVSTWFTMGFSLLVIVGVALPEITMLLPADTAFNTLRSWSPLATPKMSIVYMILPLALAQTGSRRFEQQLLLYILLVVNYITFFPAILILFTVVAVYQYLKSKWNRKEMEKAVVLIVAASLPIVIWLLYNTVKSPEVDVSMPGVTEMLQFYLSHGISIFGVAIISLLLLFSPIAIVTLALARKNVHVFFDFQSASILVVGGIASYILLGYEVESFQLFQNVAIPTCNVFFLLVLFNALTYCGRTVRVASISVLLLVLVVRLSSPNLPLTTVSEIQRTKAFFPNTEVMTTAFIRNKETMKTLRGKSPRLNPPAESILAALNNYQPISINELSWDIGNGFYVKQEANFKSSSALINYVHEKKLEHLSVIEVQRKFLEENDIQFLEIERGAELIVPHNQIIDSLQMDNGTKVYKLAYKPIVAPIR